MVNIVFHFDINQELYLQKKAFVPWIFFISWFNVFCNKYYNNYFMKCYQTKTIQRSTCTHNYNNQAMSYEVEKKNIPFILQKYLGWVSLVMSHFTEWLSVTAMCKSCRLSWHLSLMVCKCSYFLSIYFIRPQ